MVSQTLVEDSVPPAQSLFSASIQEKVLSPPREVLRISLYSSVAREGIVDSLRSFRYTSGSP